jgi:hypothetical protein
MEVMLRADLGATNPLMLTLVSQPVRVDLFLPHRISSYNKKYINFLIWIFLNTHFYYLFYAD